MLETTSGVEKVDVWETLEPVDISPDLPSDFESLVMSKQWKERKEGLEVLFIFLAIFSFKFHAV